MAHVARGVIRRPPTMWSKAARVAARAREAVQARADASERASERTNLVPSTSAGAVGDA